MVSLCKLTLWRSTGCEERSVRALPGLTRSDLFKMALYGCADGTRLYARDRILIDPSTLVSDPDAMVEADNLYSNFDSEADAEILADAVHNQSSKLRIRNSLHDGQLCLGDDGQLYRTFTKFVEEWHADDTAELLLPLDLMLTALEPPSVSGKYVYVSGCFGRIALEVSPSERFDSVLARLNLLHPSLAEGHVRYDDEALFGRRTLSTLSELDIQIGETLDYVVMQAGGMMHRSSCRNDFDLLYAKKYNQSFEYGSEPVTVILPSGDPITVEVDVCGTYGQLLGKCLDLDKADQQSSSPKRCKINHPNADNVSVAESSGELNRP